MYGGRAQPARELMTQINPMMKDARPYLPSDTQTYYKNFSSPPIFTPQGEVFNKSSLPHQERKNFTPKRGQIFTYSLNYSPVGQRLAGVSFCPDFALTLHYQNTVEHAPTHLLL